MIKRITVSRRIYTIHPGGGVETLETRKPTLKQTEALSAHVGLLSHWRQDPFSRHWLATVEARRRNPEAYFVRLDHAESMSAPLMEAAVAGPFPSVKLASVSAAELLRAASGSRSVGNAKSRTAFGPKSGETWHTLVGTADELKYGTYKAREMKEARRSTAVKSVRKNPRSPHAGQFYLVTDDLLVNGDAVHAGFFSTREAAADAADAIQAKWLRRGRRAILVVRRVPGGDPE